MPNDLSPLDSGSAARDVNGPAELGVIAVPVPALPAAPVDRLPRGELSVPELDEDPFWRLAAAFLAACRRADEHSTDLKTGTPGAPTAGCIS